MTAICCADRSTNNIRKDNIKVMKLLSIGNSFSQDAQGWLHDIAAADGVELMTRNLYIGGCTLETHFKNLEADSPAYSYEKNGCTQNAPISSISSALLDEPWDAVTFQQQSGRAGRYDTYIPYLPKLIEAVTLHCSGAELWFHETWEYERASIHPDFGFYENDPNIMYGMIYATAHGIADRYGLGLLSSGEAVHAVKKLPEFDIDRGGRSIYRDAFHLDLIYGRMLIGYVWYKQLCKRSPIGNKFVPNGADPVLLGELQRLADRI